MTVRYVNSAAAGANNGTSWSDAYTSIAAALSGSSAGDTIYVSQSHNFSSASSITYASPGTVGNPVSVICANDGASPPTSLETTGKESVTGSAVILWTGSQIWYGIECVGGDGASSSNMTWGSTAAYAQRFSACKFTQGSTGSNFRWNCGVVTSGGSNALVSFHECTFKANHASTQFIFLAQTRLIECSVDADGTIPTTLFNFSYGVSANVYSYGCDWSALGSGKNLVDISADIAHQVYIQNCKVNASVSLTTGTHSGAGGMDVRFSNVDSGATNLISRIVASGGIVSTETVIVLSGGMSNGATSFSRKLATGSGATPLEPLSTEWYQYWNTATGSPVNISTELVTDNVTLTDAECWLEVEYLGDSGSPKSTIGTSEAALLATPSNLTSSSATWTTTGLTTPTKQKITVAVTPQLAGPIRARVCMAKASTTAYADLKILSTSSRQWISARFDGINEGASGSGGGGLFRVPSMSGGMHS